MSEAEFNELVDSIAGRTLGISTTLVGHSTVRYALETRRRLTGRTAEQYRSLLTHSVEEQNSLCQLLLISESWFEREAESITTALSVIRQRQATVSILSAPCARGEEPISALYLARKAGFTLDAVSVVGIDLSEVAIAQGQLAEFSSYSFRGTSAELRTSFFERTGAIWRAKPFVRERVALRCGNILEENLLTERFDLILCRNLLIYLDRAVQQRLLELLSQKLTPNGLLVVSAAEAPIATSTGLMAHPSSPLLFTSERQPEPSLPPSTPRPNEQARSVRPPQRTLRKVILRGIETPWELASRGYLEEAFAAALQQLENDPLNPECYFLLGLISSSGGSYLEANEWFRQTLAVDPDHEEAQLMLLATSERGIEYDRK